MLHISQPTLTRTMQHVEEAFGAILFKRGKNRIELTDTGQLAADYAKKLLSDAQNAIQAVQAYEQSQRTITVYSCAPAPLWALLPQLSSKHPDNTISSKMIDLDKIVDAVLTDQCDIGILPYACPDSTLKDTTFMSEQLFICVPKNYQLAQHSEVTFEQLNGFNCLLRDQIGFWTQLCKQHMPASRFLIQTDEFEFNELVRTSTLFHFVTDYTSIQNELDKSRVKIPIVSPEANVTFHLIYKKAKANLL